MESYRAISALPIISKLFEKLIPEHQFGFRLSHSTIDQVQRITDVIERSLEEKQVCTVLFLDVAKAFDKVWHEGLLYKLNKMLPKL